MDMVYSWKAQVCPGGVDAQAAGEEMEHIRTINNGRLESQMLVDASRPADAPLHPAFEWNDAKAAESWRKEQAAHMIRHIEVRIDEAVETLPIRAFVSVKRDEDRSYTSVQHALSDAELRSQVLASAWAELEAWRNRHAELVELAKVFAIIDKARAT